MRILTSATVLAGILLGTGTSSRAAEKTSRPNIILIMADDMGFECVGANGSTHYKTPHLDRLAAGGLRFRHAYSQPICTPSRVQIMTGRYNFRNYVQFGYLHPKEITFGNILKKAGYKTCIAGKWQLKGGFGGPKHFGFDEYCLWQLTRRPSRYPNPGVEVNGKTVDYRNGEYGPDVVSDYLVDFIKRNKKGPFFAYYPMILPHWPFGPTPDSPHWDPGNKKLWKNKNSKDFKGMVAYVDKLVGKLDRTLRDQGIRDNTLIIFTCDNGTYGGVTAPFRGRPWTGGKGTTPDAGTHVPMIVSWPGVIKTGRISDDLIDFSDILPTLADIGGGKLPTDRKIDGRSFLPQLQGKKGNPRDWTFCWYTRNGVRKKNVVKRFARNQTYKLYFDDRFYNVPNDLREKTNLASDKLDTAARQTRARLGQVLKSLHSQEGEYSYTKPKAKKKRNKRRKTKSKNK